jgi:hypothetical protein
MWLPSELRLKIKLKFFLMSMRPLISGSMYKNCGAPWSQFLQEVIFQNRCPYRLKISRELIKIG